MSNEGNDSLRGMMQEARPHIPDLAPAAVGQGMSDQEVDVLVDVRESQEWDRGHVPGAVHIARGWLEMYADPDSPLARPEIAGQFDARIVTYCWSSPGARSLLAANTLRRMGYHNVSTMSAGLKAWKDEGREIERPEDSEGH